MTKRIDGSSLAEAPVWLKAVSGLLLAMLLVSVFAFAGTYSNLNQSINEERVESVQQIGSLISKKLKLLKQGHEEDAEMSARFLTHSGAITMEEVKSLLGDSNETYLLAEDGRCLSLEGQAIVISSTMLTENIHTWEDVKSEFCTVQSKGDFWVFAAPVEGVVVDGMPIAGLLKVVDAQQYADVAILPIFNGQGASYVVDENGVILLRPSDSQANKSFESHNIVQILEKEHVDQAVVDTLRSSLKNCTEAQFLMSFQGDTWLLQSFPDGEGRNIVMAIPVSRTAQKTFEGMQSVIGLVAVIVLIVAMLSISWMYYFVSRNQKVKIESARVNLKSDFLTKMSHDIRTPLNAIMGSNELALRSIDDSETLKKHLETSRKSGEYLLSIINDMLDLSRIESGKMTMANRPFALPDLLDSIIVLQSGPAEKKGVVLKESSRHLVHERFLGDDTRIKQCLVNLVSNAVKFTPEQGTVLVSCEELAQEGSDSRIRFTVKDTGIGMSESFMKRLFEPFEQEQSSLTSTQIGSGLGLPIVHNLVSLMGGTVHVESAQDAGTTFVVEIPLKPLDEPCRPADDRDSETPRPDYSGTRILLAEDNEMNREIIVDLLSDLGVDVETACNGAEALEMVASSEPGRYALVLMDIQMPVMNGLEAASAIRASGHLDAARLPIIALSAGAFEEDVQRSLHHGMQDHLSKPMNLDDVRDVFHRFIDQQEEPQ